jgi:hypothetical protein
VQIETVAQHLQLIVRHLLDLVGGVASLDLGAERPALHGLGEDDRGCSGAQVLHRRAVGGVELAIVVTAAGKEAQLIVGEVVDELAQARVGAEEVLTDVGAGLHGVALELAVHRGGHLVQQHAVHVAREQLVPLGTPDDLDDVPAGAAEHGFEFLDDLAVAADRAVQALQVAVDDEDEVVELLARRQRQRAQRFGLVGLAVAEERPHAGFGGVVEPAVVEVAVEAGLVDRVDRAEAHRHGGELPEVRHEAGMRIAGEPLAATTDLPPEVVQVVLGQAAFEVGAGVRAGRCVALDVDVVTGLTVVLATEEVVEADLVQDAEEANVER